MEKASVSFWISVLLGTNRLFIVSEMSVPSLRHAKGLVAAIRERLGDGPHPQVVVNRFEQRMFEPGLKKSDIEQALGDDFAGTIPNHYRLVREAIDRGVPLEDVKPRNNVVTELKKLLEPQEQAKPSTRPAPAAEKSRSPLWAR